MSEKLILPRQDHEVYLIPQTPEMPAKKPAFNQFIADKLRELHPGFSSFSAYDIQKLIIASKPWYIITVMEQESLAEYRLLHPKTLFFTRTSLMLHASGIEKKKLYQFADETIGYQAESQSPLSFPWDSGIDETEADTRMTEKILTAAPRRYAVFSKRRSPLFSVLPIAAALAIGAGVFMYQTQKARPPLPEITEVEPEIQIAPSPFVILSDTAKTVFDCGGTILQWKYDENAEPALFFSTDGGEPEKLIALFSLFSYMKMQAVSDIRYTDGRPQYSLSFSLDLNKYTIPQPVSAITQEEFLLTASIFRARLSYANAQIVSETLPGLSNGTSLYSVQFTCSAVDFSSVLAVFERITYEESLHIPYMNVIFESQTDIFTVSASLNFIYPVSVASAVSIDNIPLAFGYDPTPPAVLLPPLPASPPIEKINTTGYNKIGTILEDDGILYTYYRTPEGKTVILQEGGK